MSSGSKPRVLVIGIDCLTPQLFFDRYLHRMPHTQALLNTSLWGRLESTTPPITIPAWPCMVTGKDPGQLGLYGFRNRRRHAEVELRLADGAWIESPTLWQLLSRRRRRSVVLGVPMTHPVKPILGNLVAGIPLPSTTTRWTHPPELASELEALDYMVDVKKFRTHHLEQLGADLIRLRDSRFRAAQLLLKREAWDLFFMVDMSVDRLHHAFWAHAHADHVLHDPNTPHGSFMEDFYAGLDQRLGELLAEVADDTAVFIVSDHGARSMRGSFRVNEWLLAQGDLQLKTRPQETSPLDEGMIDFSKSRAWVATGPT